MQIKCNGCNKKYTIPTERFPSQKAIKLSCPICGNKFTIDLTNQLYKINSPSGQPDESVPRLHGEALKAEVIKNVKGLPPMPHVMHKARQVMADPRMGFKDIAKVLETDQAMAAFILKLANSAYYGLRGEVSSIHEAATVLGTQTLIKLIMLANASKLLGNQLKGYQVDSGSLWRHSLAVGLGAEIIAQRKKPELSHDAFSSGLLHDAGKLVLDRYLIERQAAFNKLMTQTRNHSRTEQQLFGFDHSDIGAELCELWKIPGQQANAIIFHHCPARTKNSELADIIHIADALAIQSGFAAGSTDGSHLEEKALLHLAIEPEEFDALRHLLQESVEQVEEDLLSY